MYKIVTKYKESRMFKLLFEMLMFFTMKKN